MSPLKLGPKTVFIYKKILDLLIRGDEVRYGQIKKEVSEALENTKFKGQHNRTDHHLSRLKYKYDAVESIGNGYWKIKWLGAITLMNALGLRANLPIAIIGSNFNKSLVREILAERSISPKQMISFDDEQFSKDPTEIRDKIISEIEKILPSYDIYVELLGMSHKEVIIGLQLVAQIYHFKQMIGGEII